MFLFKRKSKFDFPSDRTLYIQKLSVNDDCDRNVVLLETILSEIFFEKMMVPTKMKKTCCSAKNLVTRAAN